MTRVRLRSPETGLSTSTRRSAASPAALLRLLAAAAGTRVVPSDPRLGAANGCRHSGEWSFRCGNFRPQPGEGGDPPRLGRLQATVQFRQLNEAGGSLLLLLGSLPPPGVRLGQFDAQDLGDRQQVFLQAGIPGVVAGRDLA